MQSDGTLFRILPLPDHHILNQAGLGLEGIPSITGFNNLTVGRYDRVLREIEPVTNMLWSKYAMGKEIPYSDTDLLDAIHPLINLLNGRYLVVPSGIGLEPPVDRFTPVGEADNYRIYKNTQALPWFYLAPRIQVVSDEDHALELLRSGQVDPSAVALVEEMLPFELTNPEDTYKDLVNVVEHNPPEGFIHLQTQSENARILVVSENYQSNWSVWVDGEPADMLRVNYVWKGVALPAGTHRVEFRYRSSILLLSRAATALCALFVVGLIAADVIRRRKWVSEGTE